MNSKQSYELSLQSKSQTGILYDKLTGCYTDKQYFIFQTNGPTGKRKQTNGAVSHPTTAGSSHQRSVTQRKSIIDHIQWQPDGQQRGQVTLQGTTFSCVLFHSTAPSTNMTGLLSFPYKFISLIISLRACLFKSRVERSSVLSLTFWANSDPNWTTNGHLCLTRRSLTASRGAERGVKTCSTATAGFNMGEHKHGLIQEREDMTRKRGQAIGFELNPTHTVLYTNERAGNYSTLDIWMMLKLCWWHTHQGQQIIQTSLTPALSSSKHSCDWIEMCF